MEKWLSRIFARISSPIGEPCNISFTHSVIYTVFHRILDLKRGWISILASFFLSLLSTSNTKIFLPMQQATQFPCLSLGFS